MVNVIGVRFQNAGKLYFFDPGALWPTPGDYVIVETSRGIEFGEVVTQMKEIDDSTLSSPLKPVVRIATEEDVQHDKDNRAAEKEAHAICQKKIAEHKLDMKLVTVEYTFDNSKILFYFTANGRVDFRSLVKDLAGVFKTRIELRQIGVRDEAKMLGGLGPCGRQICCGAFLGDFQPVSIKMAKEQNLSLNPNKISGVCGRLMCCLKYEQDQYEEIRKKMPKVGKEVITPEGNGVVWDLNVIKETVRVRIQKGDSSELKDFPMEEVQRVGAPHAQQHKLVEQPVHEEADEAIENAAPVNLEDADPAEAAAESAPAKHERPHKQRREDGERPQRRERPRDQKREDRKRGERPNQDAAPKQEQPAEGAPQKPAAPKKPEAPQKAAPAAQKPAQAEAEKAPVDWKAALARAMAEAEN
ncbi:MAG: hypothetical protein E7327_08750 [Clostridiales bacterium]|nr:hypothetical protein [Clostridiales bacterium]